MLIQSKSNTSHSNGEIRSVSTRASASEMVDSNRQLQPVEEHTKSLLSKVEAQRERKRREKARQLLRDNSRINKVFYQEVTNEPRYSHAERLARRNAARKLAKKTRKLVRDTIARMHTMGIHTESDILGPDGLLTDVFDKINCAELFDYLIPGLNLCYQIARSRSKMDIVIAGTQFWFAISGKPTNKLFMYSFATTVAAGALYGVKTQSLADKMEKARFWLTHVFSGSACRAVLNLVLAAFSLKLFDKELAKNVSQVFGKLPQMTLSNLIIFIWEQLVNLVRFGENWWNDGLKQAVIAGDPRASFINEAETYLYFKDKLTVGLPVAGYMPVADFIRKCDELITKADSLLKYSGIGADVKPIRDRNLQLRQARFDATNLVNSSTRMVPFAVLNFGTPGVGKSKMPGFLGALWAKCMNRDFDMSHIYSRVMTSQYWDGYQPFSQYMIHYSEVGNIATKLAQMQGDPVIKELTSLIDSLPFPTDQSAVDNKGKIFAHPEFVYCDTNNQWMNLNVMVVNPAAYFRRFIFVEQKVKPQYKLDMGSGIDPIKASRSPDPDMDRWIWTVTRCTPTNNTTFQSETLLSDGDVFELTQVMTTLMVNHITNQSRTKLVKNQSVDFYLQGKPTGKRALPGYYVEECAKYDAMSVAEAHKLYLSEVILPDKSWTYQVWTKYLIRRAVLGLSTQGFVETLGLRIKKIRSDRSESDEKRIADAFKPAQAESVARLVGIPRLGWKDRCALKYQRVKYHAGNALECASWYGRYPLAVVWGIKDLIFLSILLMVLWFLRWGTSMAITYASGMIKRKKDEFVSRLKLRFSSKVHDFTTNWWVKHGVALTLVGTGLYCAFKAFSYYQRNVGESESSIIEEVEEKVNAGTSYGRTPIKGSAVWNSRETVSVPGVFCGDAAELYASIARNVRRARVETDEAITTHLLGVCGQFALINTHSLGNKDSVRVRVSYTGITSIDNGVFKDTIVDKSNRKDLGNDVTLIKLVDITFRDILKHIGANPLTGCIEGYFADNPVSVYVEKGNRTLDDQIVGKVFVKDLFAYRFPQHKKGLCGMPLLVSNGKVFIAGIHVAGGGDLGFAVPLDGDKIQDAIKEWDYNLIPLASRSPQTQSEFADPHPKSPFRHEHFPGIDLKGSDGSQVFYQKSRLKKSLIYKEIPEIFQKHGFMQDEFFGKPMFKPIVRDGEYVSPFNINLRKIGAQKKVLDESILKRVRLELKERVVAFLREKDISLAPWSLRTAIDGAIDDSYLRRVNRSTSAGYGLKGKKRDHIFDDGLSSDLEGKVDKLLESYSKGETLSPIYSACLKDEPRSLEKVHSGKTRVFFSSETPGLLVQRMFLGPFYTLMVQFNEVFCTAVGLNTHSAGADVITRMLEFSDRCMAGDYGSFDVNMPFQIGHTAASVVYDVLSEMGYNEDALRITRAVLTDNLTPRVEMNGDIMDCPGLQPSGKYATAEDNSLRNLVMLMYCFYQVCPELRFFDYNLPLTYGDDLGNSIKASIIPRWNNRVYQRLCRESLGLDYTSPTKELTLAETTKTSDLEFLKRRFVYRDDIQQWVMPLNHNSLIKALQWVLPSDSVSETEQMVGALRSVIWELAFHFGAGQHREISQELSNTLNKAYNPVIPFEPPRFNDIVDAVFGDDKNSGGDGSAPLVSLPDSEIVLEAWAEHVESSAQNLQSVSLESATLNRTSICFGGESADSSHPEKLICANEMKENVINTATEVVDVPALRALCNSQIEEIDELLETYVQYNLPATHVKLDRYVRNLSNAMYLEKAREKMRLLALRQSYVSTLNFLDSIPATIQTESALADSKDGEVGETKSVENLMDSAGGEFWMASAGDTQYVPATLTNVSLEDFLRRPVEIHTSDVTTNTALKLDVWDLYTRNPSVRAKLKNFAFLRATLHVTLVISGAPFDYGNVMVSYQPLANFNRNLTVHAARFALDPNWRPLMLNYLSQERSACVVSVCENSPVEIKCPFILPKPLARLYEPSGANLSAATGFTDMVAMGSLYVWAMGVIGATNGALAAPRLQIYAHMEDVQLSGATATIIELTTESGLADERVTGPIERIASRAAEVSEMVSKVPVIGAYAQASSIAFGAMSKVAAIFGWSKPVKPEDPNYMRPEPYTNGALTIGRDTSMRLVLDPKQELSVDPRIAGTEQDEMALSYISGKMTYFHTFTWVPTDAPMSKLFGIRVNPFVDTRYNISGPQVIQPTALRFSAMPFSFWRGDIVYRFKIASNNFFRGKLAVIYEPNVYQVAGITADLSLNKQYMKVIDIQDTNTFDVCVNWCNDREWLPCYFPGTVQIHPWGGGSERSNGFLWVVPFTNLQSPDGTVPVDVHVFVAGRNMRYNNLSSECLPTLRAVTESGFADTESGNADVGIAQPVTCMELNPRMAPVEHISEQYFGEQPLSFRALLKRYQYNRTHTSGVSGGVIVYTERNFPSDNMPYNTVAAVARNQLNLYSYLRYAYLGMRGGVKHRLFTTMDGGNNRFSTVYVSNFHSNDGASLANGITATSTPLYSTLDGTVTSFPGVNGAVEFEIPFYSNNLFRIAFTDIAPSVTGIESNNLPRQYIASFTNNTSATGAVFWEETAIGEDFSFMRFQGAPMYTT